MVASNETFPFDLQKCIFYLQGEKTTCLLDKKSRQNLSAWEKAHPKKKYVLTKEQGVKGASFWLIPVSDDLFRELYNRADDDRIVWSG